LLSRNASKNSPLSFSRIIAAISFISILFHK
jgi:hypothetical protein